MSRKRGIVADACAIDVPTELIMTMQAKKMCEELPKVIKEKVPKAEAEKIKEELTANGGVVELV